MTKMNKQIQHLLFVIVLLASSVSSADALETYFLYVGDTNDTAYIGAQQGLSEANLQGQFLNQTYNLDTAAVDQIDNLDYAKYSAIFAALDVGSFIKLAEKNTGTAVFNLVSESDDLRTACVPNALHTIPSSSMKTSAEKQWQQKNEASKAVAQAWHPDFKKYAARDLNKRYYKASGKKMDDYAWSGWAAVKMSADTIARTASTDAPSLLAFLKTELQFDGQKGSTMNFRETGQLRQVVLLVDDNEIVGEAPVRGVASSLDSLGLQTCKTK